MVFLKVDTQDAEKIKKLKKYYNSNSKIFMLIYMVGCGPCNSTKPEWAKLTNVLSNYSNNEDIVIVDIDKDILQNINLKNFQEPRGFPTIVHLNNKDFSFTIRLTTIYSVT
jgi:vacuolar-type H+-ATPase subunit F/Vma7